jgi:hypothetical protein
MTVAKSWGCNPTDHQSECAVCGAKAPKYFEEHEIAVGAEYTSNQIVVRRQTSLWQGLEKLTLWDGESYHQLKYGAGRFCKLRCAEEFAMLAHMNGWRVTK